MLTVTNKGSIIEASLLESVWKFGGLQMGEGNNGNNTNENIDNKEKIIKMINKIEDAGTLEYLHTFIKLFLEKWG